MKFDTDNNTSTTNSSILNNNNEQVKVNYNKLYSFIYKKQSYNEIDQEIIIKNKIKKLYENWYYEQAQIIFKEKINKFSKVI